MTQAVDLRLLCSFRTLGDELHFARAAAALNMAQPTLSQQIRRLERQLGFDLFLRSSRRVELTDAGRVLLPATAQGMDTIHRGIEVARRVAERPALLTVGVEFDLADHWLQGIRAFVATEGRPRVRVTRLHEEPLLEALRAGRLDGALHWSPPAVSGLPGRHLGEVPVLIAMDAGHPLAAGTAVTAAQLAGHPLVLFERSASPGLWAHYLGMLTDGRPEVIEVIEVTTVGVSEPALLEAVRGTDRLTVVTLDHWARADAAGLRALPLDPPLAFPVFWSEAPGAARPEAGALADALRMGEPAAPA